MNHYAKGLVVLLVLSALSISGVYAMAVTQTTNGNTFTQGAKDNSAMNGQIASTAGAATGTVVFLGNYFLSDSVTNPEGDNAFFFASVVDNVGLTAVGSHSWSSSMAANVVTYASALSVGTPTYGVGGASTIENYASGTNAEGDFAYADMYAVDNLGLNYANMEKSFVMGAATRDAAFAWAQADGVQGDWVDLQTQGYPLGVGGFTEAEMYVGDATGNVVWLKSPSIDDYQSYSLMVEGQTKSVSVLGSGTIDATNTADILGGNTNPNGQAEVEASALTSGYSGAFVFVPNGLLSVDKLPMSFGYYDNANTYSSMTSMVSGVSSVQAYATTGADLIPTTRSSSGFGNVDYNIVAYSGIADNSGSVKITKV